MFAHIRRHQKWLWILISGLVILSFVWYFNPNQGMQGGGGGGTRSVVGSIYGEPITAGQYMDARDEAVLQYRMIYGSWPENDEFTRQMRPIENMTRQRLLLTRKVEDYDIKVTDQAMVDWIRSAFSDPQTKAYNPAVYPQFLEQIRRVAGLTEADFHRFVRHQVGIEHLQTVAGTPGKLVTPQEVERALRDEREKIDTKVVLFPLSNYLAKVNVTPEAIATYYTNAQARYRLPQRMQLSYVAFPASNYFAKADELIATQTNLNQQIDQLYLQRGPQFYTDELGQPLTAEAAKQRIRDEVRKEGALMEARKAAYDFARGLEDVQINPANPNPAEPLENLAASKGLQVQVTEPFTEFAGPRELNVPEQFARMVFQLTPEQPIVPEPITGEDAVYAIAFKRTLPSVVEPLEDVQARVTADYTRQEASRAMREAASQFLASATNAIATGAQLESVAQQSGLTVADLPPALRESRESITNLPPIVDSAALRSATMDLAPGTLSSFMPTGEGGFVVLLEKTLPATDDEVKQELPQFLQEYRRRTSIQAFNDWFSREMQLAKITIAGENDEQAMAQ